MNKFQIRELEVQEDADWQYEKREKVSLDAIIAFLKHI